MNCADVAELLPAYALHAVNEDERAQIEEHLATCELHAEALEFERVAARLPEALSASEEREPPADLRARILEASRDVTPAATTPAATTPDATTPDATQDSGISWSTDRESGPVAVPSPPPPRAQRESAGLSRFMPYAMAAALAVLVVGFVAFNPLGGSDDVRTVRATADGGLTSTLVYNATEGEADVSFEGLPALDSQHAYQLWTIGPDAAPASAGLLVRADDGSAEQSLIGTFEDGTTFAITVEPAGGSEQPTTTPLIATTL